MFQIKTSKADRLFSRYIRANGKWTCARCHWDLADDKRQLHCSHYHSRSKKSTRFDIDNAAPLCIACHMYMGKNPKDHEEFFRKRLGEERFNLLYVRAMTPQRVDERLIVEWLKAMLQGIGEKY